MKKLSIFTLIVGFILCLIGLYFVERYILTDDLINNLSLSEPERQRVLFIEICGDRHAIEGLQVVKPILNTIHVWRDCKCGYENGYKTQRIIYRNVSFSEQKKIFDMLDKLRK